MIVFVVVDAAKQHSQAAGGPNQSILDLQTAEFVKNSAGEMEVKMLKYLDTFPFSYYLIVRDVHELPGVLAGDCLVNALYGVFQDGHPGFEAKYLEMLRAGGTKRHKELLAPFGLDASDPAFWTKGLDVISGFIDELED